MTVIIKNFAISGFRSFGKETQYFENLAKINLLIGRNNSGKSNVIRFISEIYQKIASGTPIKTNSNSLDAHLPNNPPLLIGRGIELRENNSGEFLLSDSYAPLSYAISNDERNYLRNLLSKVFATKKQVDHTELCWSLINTNEQQDLVKDGWIQAFTSISDNDLQRLWTGLTNSHGGDKESFWLPGILQKLRPSFETISVEVIPAVRQIGAQGSSSTGFDGQGIIERLAKLQNPSVQNSADKKRFYEIRDFLRNVIDNPSAEIEIPYERNTIIVHMDNKSLPIESLGSGIHEVIILAAAATTLKKHVVCIEEPELHLNPLLQKKLMRYLSEHTDNQYFVSTHSAALMDTPDVEIYHVHLDSGRSVINRVTSNSQRSLICEDLGYHPSDLLQANCVIWVEGPSDRLYLNYWLKALKPDLIEGIHYSIMFYGGRLASHLTNSDEESEVNDFISLRKLNRRGVMLMDSDRPTSRTPLNQTKKRLKEEFDKGPGHAWITDGREIENYLPSSHIKQAIEETFPSATSLGKFSKYDNVLKVTSAKNKEIQASKIKVAHYITDNFEPDFSLLDLRKCMNKLVQFILDSNPSSKVI